MINFRKNPNLEGEVIIDKDELLELLNYKLNALNTKEEFHKYNPEELEDDELELLQQEIEETEKEIELLENY